MYKQLSYKLFPNAPVYPGNPEPLVIEPFSRIEKGDKCNTYKITTFNHDGTHIDGPEHFNKDAREKISNLDINSFIFNKPFVVNLEGKIKDMIYPGDIKPFSDKIKNSDFLLMRTGFSNFRDSDLEKYTKNYPVFSEELSLYLVENFKTLKGVGIDCVSVGSVKFPEEGPKVHRILNGQNKLNKYLLILEDVNIPEDVKEMKRLFIIPFFIEGVDSLPATVFCEM
jgi:kynurenine formamidase